jgi:conjugal transfer pilus assembly protein TraA
MKLNLSAPRHFAMLFAMALVASMLAVVPETAFAGSGGTELNSIWETIKGWTEGTLGRLVTLIFIIVGLIGGIAKQSLIAFAIGLGGGIGLYNAPEIFTATMVV